MEPFFKSKYKNFSASQKRIADFIVKNFPNVATFSSHKLAEKTGVSPSTIVRFAHQLGYEGYPDFLKALQDYAFLSTATPMKKIHDSLDENEKLENVLNKVLQHESANINAGKFLTTQDSFVRAAKGLIKGERIFVIGGRTSYSVAHYAGFVLRQMCKNVHYFSSGIEDPYERLEDINEQDVALFISYHRYFRNTIDLAAFAQQRKTFVIGLTDSISSPITEYCDEFLLAPNDSPFHSYLPAMAVINALILAFAQSRKEVAKELLDKRRAILMEKKIYV